MEVLIEFGQPESEVAFGAVWIVGTPENQAWFEQHRERLDPNSAVFREGAEPKNIIWNVLDHHPEWTLIVLRSAPLTAEAEESVRPDAVIVSRGLNEVRLRRP